jgi:cobalt-zinc-cadmium efflux system outer membrane protein
MAFPRARRFAACVISILPALVVAQVPQESSPTIAPVTAGVPLSLRDAVVAALRGNPDLKGFAFSLRAQDARADAARLRPAPVLSAELENFAGTGTASGVSALEATFALSQVVELAGKRALRVDVAKSGRSALDIERRAAQLDVLAEVSRRYIEVAAGQQRLDLARQGFDLARQTAEAVQRRVDAAKSPMAEIRRATVELKRADIERRHAEHQLLSSRVQLAAMWGEPAAGFGDANADLFNIPPVPEFETLIGRLEANPDFLRFASEARVRDAELRLAQAQRTPDIQLSIGVRRLQNTRDQALVAGFSMPLFSRSQAAPAISEARALRDQVDSQSESHRVRVRTQLYALHQELRHSVDEAGLLRSELLPEIEKALEETRYAYDRGRYGYLELVDGQRAFLEVKRAYLDAAINAQLLQTEIERLTGVAIAESNP